MCCWDQMNNTVWLCKPCKISFCIFIRLWRWFHLSFGGEKIDTVVFQTPFKMFVNFFANIDK